MTQRIGRPMLELVGFAECTSIATVDDWSDPSGRTDTTEVFDGPDAPDDGGPNRPSPIHEEADPVQNTTATTVVTTAAVRIQADDGRGQLEVAVDSNPGWTVPVHRRRPTDIDVVWTARGSRVEATVVAGDSGISTSTRSVRTLR